jgi:lysophospholipase L1-like esterase
MRLLRDAAIIALATVLLTEVGFRAYNFVSPSVVFAPRDYNAAIRAKPFSQDYDFQINSRGFKDVEFSTKTPAGTIRIVALGDSFTYGAVPYAANYITLLKPPLRERFGNVEVLNMGIPGTGPRDYLQLFRTEAAALQPDIILVSLFLGNDLVNETRDERRRVRSYLYDFARYVFRLTTKTTGQLYHGPSGYIDDAPVFTDDFYVEMERDRSQVFKRDLGAAEQGIQTALEHVREIKQLSDRVGTRLYVVIIPDEVQVDQDLQAKVIRRAGALASDYDFGALNRRISQFLEGLGVAHIDLLPALLARSGTARLYRVNDSHWNIAGNKVAADAIFRDMLARPEMFVAAPRDEK